MIGRRSSIQYPLHSNPGSGYQRLLKGNMPSFSTRATHNTICIYTRSTTYSEGHGGSSSDAVHPEEVRRESPWE